MFVKVILAFPQLFTMSTLKDFVQYLTIKRVLYEPHLIIPINPFSTDSRKEKQKIIPEKTKKLIAPLKSNKLYVVFNTYGNKCALH